MTSRNGLRRLGVWVALCLPALAVSAGYADEPAMSGKAERPEILAGKQTAAGGFLYHAVYRPNSIRLLVYTADGKPYSAKELRGTVTLARPGKAKVYRYPMYPEGTRSAPRNALYVPLPVAGEDTGEFRARFVIYRQRGSARGRPLRMRTRRAFTHTVVPGSGTDEVSPEVHRVAEEPTLRRRR